MCYPATPLMHQNVDWFVRQPRLQAKAHVPYRAFPVFSPCTDPAHDEVPMQTGECSPITRALQSATPGPANGT